MSICRNLLSLKMEQGQREKRYSNREEGRSFSTVVLLFTTGLFREGKRLRHRLKTHLRARPYRICAIALVSASRPNIAVDRSKSAERIENSISCRFAGKQIASFMNSNITCAPQSLPRRKRRERRKKDRHTSCFMKFDCLLDVLLPCMHVNSSEIYTARVGGTLHLLADHSRCALRLVGALPLQSFSFAPM